MNNIGTTRRIIGPICLWKTITIVSSARLVACARASHWGRLWAVIFLTVDGARTCASLEIKGASRSGYILPYIMHLAHLLLCKGAVMKRVFSLRNGNPASLILFLLFPFLIHPPPCGHACCWRCGTELQSEKKTKSPLTAISDGLRCLLNAGRPWWKILIIHRKCCLLRHHIFPELAHFQQLPPIVHSALINAGALLAFVPRQCT